MSPSPAWYRQHADTLYGRADECLRLADELDGSPLVSLLGYAGDDTWQCPAAEEYRADILRAQGKILDAIEALRSNAIGLGNDADQMSRTAADVAAQERAAAQEAERQRELELEAS